MPDSPSHPRVAVLCLSMAGGGAELAVARLVNGLAARGYRVDLVLWRKTGPVLDKVDREVNIVELAGPRPLILLKLGRYFLSTNPSIVLSHQTFLNVLAALALRLTFSSTPLVATEHNAYTRALVTKRGWIGWVYRMAPLFYGRCNVVAAVSTGVAKDAQMALKVPASRLRIVYNPAVSPRVHQQAQSLAAPHPWLAEGQPPTLICVGRLVPQKNPEMLLKAFAKARSQEHCRLILLGAGGLQEALEEAATSLGINQDVHFAGFEPNPYPWIARAHTLVLASDFEGFAIVVAEALALGTRVVSTDCDFGPAEILKEGQYGRLVPVGDDDALAHAMVSSIRCEDPPGARQERQRRGEQYSESKYLDRYEAIMNMLLVH